MAGRLTKCAAAAAAAAVPIALLGASPPAGWPAASSPRAEGLHREAFARWAQSVEQRDTRSLVVLRNDRLVLEWHAQAGGRTRRSDTASLVKGVVGGLALAALAEDGALALDEPASRYVARWRDDPEKSRITLRQLASHRSGLADATGPQRTKRALTGWKRRFWLRDGSRTPMHVALEEAPLRFAAGSGFEYSNPGFAVLSVALASALARAGQPALPEYLRHRVYRRIGVPDAELEIGYGRAFAVDGLAAWATWGGGKASAGALLRIGRLLLRRGDWDGTRVLAPETVEALFAPTADSPSGWPAPALGWWTNERGRWPRLPRDAFLAAGISQQLLLVVPSLDLVVVRLGGPLDRTAQDGDFWEPLGRLLLDPLADAFGPPPLPRSDRLAGAWFEPASTLRCEARGSDNWPITWEREGTLFASYGDGRGFDPAGTPKLSQGFARIRGGPSDFSGANVRAPTGERTGDGARGAKASGILAAGGALYLFARNLDNSRLAWSRDGGRSWEWGFRFEESFGSPTFLNFGRDYAGARDGFVYVYSQDGPSAYEADDRVVLARVPRDRIPEREAWEFYAGAGEDGAPRWSRRLEDREGVVEIEDACRRSEVVFAPTLGRYLMALGFDAEGGWGLFEAPEPWGPWRTVYATRRWDLGDMHSYRMPSAWIGERELAFVVSGRDREGAVRDAFCVRRARLWRIPEPPGR